MTQKDKYLFAQLGLTCLLLITSVFMLNPAVFGPYQLLLIGGSIVGFVFGWCNRQRVFAGMKYFTDAAILITIIWVGYQIFNSTFLYEEIIALLIQGIIILEIIFSFNFSVPQKTAYIWLLSLLIFITSPIFAIAYSLLLAIGYLLVWLAILRFQFAEFLQPFKEKGPRRYYSLVTSLVCFLFAIFLAWLISSNVYLGRIKKGMVFLSEDLQDPSSGSGKESSEAEKFYSLQDDLQKKLTSLALKLDFYEKRRQLVYLLSELIKDTTKTLEVDKAETGLVDILKRQGAGLDGATQAMTLIKKYINKKNSRDLQKNKEEIMDKIKDHPVGIINKIKIISLANKIQQASSYQQLQENSRALQSAIQKVPLNEDVQQDLSALARGLSSLKIYEFYRSKIQDLEQRPSAFDEKIEKKMGDILSDIQHAESRNDFKQVVKKNYQLKNNPQILEQKSTKEALKNLEEALFMKLDLFFPKESEKIKNDAAMDQASSTPEEEFNKKVDLSNEVRAVNETSFNGSTSVEKVELKEIKITPKSLEIGLGEEGKFSAMGIYNDGSSKDLTILGSWGILDKSIAKVLGGNVACVSLGQTSAYVEFEGVRSEYARVIVREARLVSLLLTPQSLRIPRDGEASLKVQGNYYDHSQRDLTAQVSWNIEGPQVVKIDNGVARSLRFGQSKISAEYSRLKSNTSSINVILTFAYLLWFLAKIIFFLLLGILFAAGILYLLQENKRNQLRLLKEKPREFILGLYENASRLISIFGLRYNVYTFPLFYAELARQKFLVKNNDFLNFSIKFEEAKYSQHVLQDSDVAAAVNDYNNFFERLCKNQRRSLSFYRYCLALMHRRPIFILSAPEVPQR